jgi:uncharacterized protein YdcH (DUF465 family)
MNVKEVLLSTDETFRRLVSEHQSLDERILSLSSLAFLTEEQQYEESSLKKRKLVLKDRIEALLRSYHMAGATTVTQH